MYSFPDLKPVCCSTSSFNCCFLTCIQISQEASQMVWYSHHFKSFPQFIVIHTDKDFGIFNKADSVQFSRSVLSDYLQSHGLQHNRPLCLLPTPRVYSNSCPLSQWWHPAISSSLIPVSSCLQSFPASGSFQISQFFASGGQSIGVSASVSVLPMNIQDWFPLGWTGWISLLSKGLSRVFSNTTVQKHHYLSLSLL